ncbi:endonuclease NucS domain-containing protein [Halorientalis salina]|uniref:endonuclease NucS domain-containing protein n=1 Tax=Halorientalis salina TaxID=2932266 RepID=UPI0010AB6A6D|nr:endonuclease NucS domain-containing protein [Halorientalis salina]
MHDGTRVLAGECTTTFEGSRDQEHHGEVLIVCKPDNTVLVHDSDGYQPVAWLTRADSVSLRDGTLTATDGDQRLRVETHEEYGSASYPTSPAGVPVGDCPGCDGRLVRADGAVRCLGCDTRHGIPRDATVLDESCECGHPRMRVARGRAFEVCIDRDCESLDEAVKAAYDREWSCPHCDGDLRILRRGGLLAGCEHYPDCDTGWGIPAGTVVGECDCGLPRFETGTGERCLDSGCQTA